MKEHEVSFRHRPNNLPICVRDLLDETFQKIYYRSAIASGNVWLVLHELRRNILLEGSANLLLNERLCIERQNQLATGFGCGLTGYFGLRLSQSATAACHEQ